MLNQLEFGMFNISIYKRAIIYIIFHKSHILPWTVITSISFLKWRKIVTVKCNKPFCF